ncbi:hypothetical protein J3R82DRAFT_9810 [Butyriboletus roseoflavus]|nr:hypothetical protein J3R82DRAFT_9810 [Butyriboletus roseoflavus]
MRLKAEAIFAARKDKADFVPCEFVDYKGESGLLSISHLVRNPGTVHSFALPMRKKAGFKGSLSQTVEWFWKTLAS